MLVFNNLVILIVYLAILAIISIIAHFYSKTHDSYLIGDRSLNSFTAAISAGAADMSGWLLLGLPGAIYVSGLNQTWIAIGLFVGAYYNWTFLAGKLRAKSQELKSITLPDFLSKHVANNDASLRVIASVMIIIFFTIYVSSGFVAGAKVFSQYLEIDYHYGLFITYSIIAISTIIGGFLAVSWGELFQGLVMVGVMILIPTLSYMKLSGVEGEFVNNIITYNPNMFDMFYDTSIIGVVSLLAWGLGYFGQPHILSKFMALKSPDIFKKARTIAMIWMITGLFFSIIIGFIGASVFFKSPLKDPELVILVLSEVLLHPWFIGLVMIAILSAIFSTANAQILIVSSVFTNDLKILKSSVNMNRLLIILVGLFAVYLGWNPDNKVLSMVGYAWAGFGACFGPIMILSLNMKKKIHKRAAISGILVGGITVILWNILGKFFPNMEIFKLYELLPAFILSIISILIFNKNNAN